MNLTKTLLCSTALLALSQSAFAQQPVLNLYSSRHYNTDEALYTNFEKKTGIKINRVEAGEDALLERIKTEGDKSPADVLLTVDVGRLWRAEQAGYFQKTDSKVLNAAVPESLRHPDGLWFGFSVRARPIYYARGKIDPKSIANYEDLAKPEFKGTICSRSGGHVYSLSMMGSIIQANGADKAEAWAKGVVANFARQPKGGDTDQIKGIAAGECQIAIGNTYYFARLMKSNKPEDKEVVDKVGVVFPNQANRGAHINVSGGGVLKYAPNKAAAVQFLEYLVSAEAQEYFANGNNEYPASTNTIASNPALKGMGEFKREVLNVTVLGKNQALAQQIYDRAGWK
jgi:iron(III) transport system substrate-binding protein